MRGRKPKLTNVIPMRGDDGGLADDARDAMIKRAVDRLRPRGLSPVLRKEWDHVATILADPVVDRLKPRFVDVITEYCRARVQLRDLRAAFDKLAKEVAAKTGSKPDPLMAQVYRVKGRNGDQAKMHPFVAQIHATWGEWRSCVAMLGLSPADERNILPGQGDLFDESEREFA